jgi:hypothetical protein
VEKREQVVGIKKKKNRMKVPEQLKNRAAVYVVQ